MVALLNLLGFVVCAGLIWGWWKTKKVWFLGALLAFAFIYPQIQPSYMPKGAVTRTTPPPFDPPSGEIKDSARKPTPSEIRNERQKEEYRNGLDFK